MSPDYRGPRFTAPAAHDRRRFLVLGAMTATSAALGVGALLRRRPSASSSLGAAGRTSTTVAPATTTTSPAEPTTTRQAPTTTQTPTTEQPAAAPTTEAPNTQPTAATGTAGVTVNVLCRSAWGAVPPSGELPKHTIREMVVHHTALVLNDNRAAPGRIRDFQAKHQGDGFVDLAYHYVIDAAGNIYEARSTAIPGETYTNYDPTGRFLAVCDGNFEQQPVPAAQLDALARLLAWAGHHFGVAPDRLTGHRDLAATACPGQNLYRTLADGSLEGAIRGHLAAGVPRLVLSCGPEASARVRAIEAG